MFGIKAGDMLLKINGREIKDVLDYRFYSYDPKLTVELSDENGIKEIELEKDSGGELGLLFETYLMDKMRVCKNRCIFCFVDQMPKGMRESLYVKDDDARLSFLSGNYISLTNLSKDEVKRIKEMKISPINISVQTTEEQLRNFMLGNKRAGESLSIMKEFCAAHISMNCQIVVCPGINDGGHLTKSLADLTEMYPYVSSISVVPVGLTKYREHLYPLIPVDAKSAGEIIDIADRAGDMCAETKMSRVVYAADELFLQSGRPIPETEYYEDFPQFENGVGMLSLFREQFRGALSRSKSNVGIKDFALATGTASKGFISGLIDEARIKCNHFDAAVYGIENNFFGCGVSVSGLITGKDIIAQLCGKNLPQSLLIPVNMLRHKENVFLDDVTVSDVERELSTKITVVENDGADFFDKMIKR